MCAARWMNTARVVHGPYGQVDGGGQHTDEVLGELLGIEGKELTRLREDAII